MPMLVLAQRANAQAWQTFFQAIFQPRALIVPMQPALRRHPDAPVLRGPYQADDLVEPTAHFRPVPAVELPDLVDRGAPEFAISQLCDSNGRLRTGFVRCAKIPPFLLAIASRAAFRTQPKVAIL